MTCKLDFAFSFQARYDILSESNKNEGSELSSEGGTSSHSRRMIESSTFENASRALVPCSAGKETVNEEEAATPANGDISDTQPEDEKNEPKDLLTAMDSFDNLFCRRCLVLYSSFHLPTSSMLPNKLEFISLKTCLQVFDCRLHGCSQAIVHPVSHIFSFSQLCRLSSTKIEVPDPRSI